MIGTDGRLHSRPGVAADPWPTGLHPLDGGLILVPAVPQPAGLVIYFHGAGGTASGGLTIWKDVSAGHGLLVLLANSTGSTWDLIRGGLGPDVSRLDRQLAEVFERYAPPRIAMAGFSDGASYALSLGLANGGLVDTVLAFSPGFLAAPRRAGRPAIWISHGTADTVLPVDICGRRVVRQLRLADYEAEYLEFDGGHVITPELVGIAVTGWLRRREGGSDG